MEFQLHHHKTDYGEIIWVLSSFLSSGLLSCFCLVSFLPLIDLFLRQFLIVFTVRGKLISSIKSSLLIYLLVYNNVQINSFDVVIFFFKSSSADDTLIINFILLTRSAEKAREKIVNDYRTKIEHADWLLPCDPCDEIIKKRIRM